MPLRISIIVFILSSSILKGQTAFNPNLLPLGEEEALLANTGTGRIGSTGSVFYNPAALASLDGTSFSLSGSAYTLSAFEANPLEVINGQELVYTGTGYQTIPTSIIMARKFGEWRLAFSVLIPMQLRFEGTQRWEVTGNPGGDILDVRVTQYYREKMSLTGLTLSRPINEKWSWGVSLYSQYYTYTSQVDLTAQFQQSTDFYFRNSSRIRLNPTNLLIMAGVHRKGENLDWGLRLTVPSIHIYGRGDFYSERYERTDAQTVNRELVETGRVQSRFITPWDLRFGIHYRFEEKWNASLDISIGTAEEYQVFDTEAVDTRLQIKNSFRISTGWERIFSEKLSGFVGISYMPTDLDPQEGRSSSSFEYTSVSIGSKMQTGVISTTLGIYYAQGASNTNSTIGPSVWRENYSYLGGFIGTQYSF